MVVAKNKQAYTNAKYNAKQTTTPPHKMNPEKK